MGKLVIAGQQNLDQRDRQKDRERIVGAGFDLQRCGDARAQPQTLRVKQKEYRGRVSGCHHRADQHGLGPADPQQILCKRRRECGRQQHADRRQGQRRGENAAECGQPGTQTAIEQDQGERDGADQIGGPHIVELDAAGTGFAGQHADRQKHQQQRGAKPQRHKARQDARKHQCRAQQNCQTYSIENGHNARILFRIGMIRYAPDNNFRAAPIKRRMIRDRTSD